GNHMSCRLVALWLMTLGFGFWFCACGNGGEGARGTDASVDGASSGGHDKDATLKGSDAPPGLGGGDSSPSHTCKPKTCADLNATCGAQGDGCGNSLQCGTCKKPKTCGGGGVPNHC